jgi:DNA repair protein RadC
LTQRIQATGQLLDIALLDHIIVGDEESFVSFQAEPARFAPARAAETC